MAARTGGFSIQWQREEAESMREAEVRWPKDQEKEKTLHGRLAIFLSLLAGYQRKEPGLLMWQTQ